MEPSKSRVQRNGKSPANEAPGPFTLILPLHVQLNVRRTRGNQTTSNCVRFDTLRKTFMTAQKLFGILKFLNALDNELGVQSKLEKIRDTLENLLSAPANPGHQNTLASNLASFKDAASKLHEAITPSQSATIAEMGGSEFFDPEIANRVEDSIRRNAMTPSVARDFVQDLSTRRSGFMTTVRNAVQALERLRITDEGVPPGTGDVAFLIPRDLFGNHLEHFTKEL